MKPSGSKNPVLCECGRQKKKSTARYCGVCWTKKKNETAYRKTCAANAYKKAVLHMLRCTSPPATAEQFADSVNSVIIKAKVCCRLGVDVRELTKGWGT